MKSYKNLRFSVPARPHCLHSFGQNRREHHLGNPHPGSIYTITPQEAGEVCSLPVSTKPVSRQQRTNTYASSPASTDRHMWRPAEAEVLRRCQTPDESIRGMVRQVVTLTGPGVVFLSPEFDPWIEKGPQGSNDVRRGLVSFDTYRGPVGREGTEGGCGIGSSPFRPAGS